VGVLDRLRDRTAAIVNFVGNALPEPCPVPWWPNAFAPVFSGYRHYAPNYEEIKSLRSFGFHDIGIELGAPTPLRVWFPSIGGSPQNNDILSPCGQYPLVVFAHGQCHLDDEPASSQSQGAHYLAWGDSRIVRQQARAGYVAVVPQLRGATPGEDQDLDTLRLVVEWIRSDWEHARLLAPPPATALIGHSYGSVHAARLAAEGGVTAYASLSDTFSDWYSIDPGALDILGSIDVPKLFFFGSEEQELDRSWLPPTPGESRSPGTWDGLSRPKHQAVIEKMAHYDYLLPGLAPCEGVRGPCSLAPDIAADVVTMFLARYLSPPAVPTLSSRVPATLAVPPDWQDGLSWKQLFYAGAYFRGVPSLSNSSSSCQLTLTYELSGASGIIRLPT
jgi:hypothetical protein